MQNHPDQLYFTALGPATGQSAPVPAPRPQLFSPDENNLENKWDFLRSCCQAAGDAVDEARAALTGALFGPSSCHDDALINHMTRAYILAASFYRDAQRELRKAQEMPGREALMRLLQEARAAGRISHSPEDFLLELERPYLPPPPPHSHSQGNQNSQGTLS